MANIGRCPDCKGAGNTPRDGSGFPQLCGRCNGSGRAALDAKEIDTDFARRAGDGYAAAEQRRAASNGNRPFQSGMDPADLRKRRDEIRRLENRAVPPAEPKPDPVTPAAAPADARKCPCGMAVGDCNGCCD